MKRVLLGLAALLACAGPALAQGPSYPTSQGNTRAPGVLQMCMDRRGFAVPCSLSDTVADVLHRYTAAGREHRASAVSVTPNDAGTVVSSAALAANLVISALPANLLSFNVSADSTLSGAAWWIMIYDAVSAPSDGAVTPAKCYAMPSGTTNYSAAFGQSGVRFKTGIVIGVGTNGCFTKAASTHAFISGDFR